MRSIVLCVAASLLAACDASPSAQASGTSLVVDANATVVRVVDGDTIVVDVGDQRETVRLIGIDTPETVKPDAPVECWGPEASARTKALLPAGTPVRLVRDDEARDAYDRLLAYVYRADDGVFVNLALIDDGFATVLTFRPNTAHEPDFVAAATRAERAGRGLWSACPESGR